MTEPDDEGQAGAGRIAALEAELARAQARLREVDHRFKNDLQLIASVFVLQMRRLPEGEARSWARNALARVSAVAAVHRRLDVVGDPKRFEVSAVVRDLAEEALAAARRDDLVLALDLEPVHVPARQAAPLAIVTGELVRNAVGHAFAEGPGVLNVALTSEDGSITLEVRDDGCGLADAPPGFGLALVGLLAQQLRGRFEIAAANPGVRAVLRFPETLAGSP